MVALLLAMSALLSACTAGQGALTGNDVVQKMREALKSNQTAQGTVELSAKLNKEGLKSLAASMIPGGADIVGKDRFDMLPDMASITLKVWKGLDNKGRVEVGNSTLPGVTGTTLVYDGKKVYAYIPAHNKVYIKTPGDKSEMPGAFGGMWGAMTPEERGDKLVEASDIKLVGSEQVDGKDSYKLEVTPKADALTILGVPTMFQMIAGNLIKDAKATVWVDKERWIPVKTTLEHPQVGTFTYTGNLELDKPVDEAQFVLQIPAGAEVVDIDALHERMQPKTMTLPEARAEVAKDGWKLLEPSYLPEKATLVEVTRLPGMMAGPVGGCYLPYFPADVQSSGSSDEIVEYIPSSSPSNYLSWLYAPSPDPTTGKAEFGGFHIAGSGILTGAATPPQSPSFMLRYSSPTIDFSINESKSEIEKGLGDGFSGINGGDTGMKEVTVRGVKAVAFSPDGAGWTSLMWQDTSGVWVHISGKLTVEETVKIAEGLQ
jgi:outer membrane lipoprotein-sorting protein